MTSIETDVAIIGAGSTGLLLAQGLKSAGISSQVFERDEQDRAFREWSMSLHWGGEFLSQALPPELRARIGEINTDPRYDSSKDTGFVQCNGETAETILVMAGHQPRRVSRRKLRDLMSEGIDVRYKKKVESIEADPSQKVINATFVDGTTVKAKLLIGCDGSRSRVRETMVGDSNLSKLVETGHTMFNFPCKYPTDVAKSLRDVHPIFKCAYHPKLPMMYLLTMANASDEEPAGWVYQNLISWTGPPYASDLPTQEARTERLKAIGSAWGHPWSTAATQVPEGTTIWADAGAQWDPRPVFKVIDGKTSWNGHEWEGLVTIAGDAAHPMLPHRGQGLNNALEDASKLLAAVRAAFQEKTKTLSEAIAEYETEMVARGGLEVEVTNKQARAAHDWDFLMQSPMFKHGANKSK